MNIGSILLNTLPAEQDEALRIRILQQVFHTLSEKERSCFLGLLLGRIPGKLINLQTLRTWSLEISGYPDWLITECEKISGDRLITASLILPIQKDATVINLYDTCNFITVSHGVDEALIKMEVLKRWRHLDRSGIILFNRLLTGKFVSPVKYSESHRFLSLISGVDQHVIANRLSGNAVFEDLKPGNLFRETNAEEMSIRPFAFQEVDPLNDPNNIDLLEFTCEWQLPGIRVQLVKKDDDVLLWRRDAEQIANIVPVFKNSFSSLPTSCVFDTLLVWLEDGVPVSKIQTEKIIDRSRNKNIKGELVIYLLDVLSIDEKDYRQKSLKTRREIISGLIGNLPDGLLRRMNAFDICDESELRALSSLAIEHAATGIILKKLKSHYTKEKGAWLKYQTEKKQIDLMLMYAKKNLSAHSAGFDEYTFGIEQKDGFLPVARCSPADDSEIATQLEEIVSGNTLERFGPVHSVKPEFCFTIGYGEIIKSKRHKAGITLGDVEILKTGKEKAATLEELYELYNIIREQQISNYKNQSVKR